MAIGIRDLRVGRLGLPTFDHSLKEMVGSPLDSENGVVLAKKRTKGFTLSIPIHGTSGDTDEYAAGERMRRQARALLDNDQARADGLYLRFAADPAFNGWLMVGQGDLEYADGGVSLSEYKLTLDEVFRLGNSRTHREGRRCVLLDRRSSSTQQDYLGVVVGAQFAAYTAFALNVLPPSSTPTVGTLALSAALPAAGPVTLGSRSAFDASAQQLVTGRSHGDIVNYERTEAQQGMGDVVFYDRQGKADLYTNLVTNPSFEIDTTGWATSGLGTDLLAGATLTRVTAQHVAGAAALQVVTTAANNNQGAALNMGVLPAGTYFASAWVKGNAGGEAVEVWAGPNPAPTPLFQSTLGTGWLRVSATFVADGINSCIMMTRGSAAAIRTWFFDAACVTAGATDPGYIDGDMAGFGWNGIPGQSTSGGPRTPESWGGTNYVRNPGVEVNLTDWDGGGGGYSGALTSLTRVVDATTAKFGTSYAKAVTTASSNSGLNITSMPSPPLAPGQMWTFSVWLKAPSPTTLEITGLDTGNGTFAVPSVFVNVTTQWQRFLAPFVVGPGWVLPQNMTFAIRHPAASSVEFHVDGAMLTQGDASAVPAFYDGDSTGYAWFGARGASPSTLTDYQVYGWEELYGPDQVQTAGDVPVLANGLARVRWVSQQSAFAVDDFVPGVGYVEQGRFVVLGDTTGTIANAVQFTTLISKAIAGWTQEVGVLRVSLGTAVDPPQADIYITLQRGWTGPKVEVYARGTTTNVAGVAVRYTPNTSGENAALLLNPNAVGTAGSAVFSADPAFTWAGASFGWGSYPNVELIAQGGANLLPCHIAHVLSTPTMNIVGRNDSLAYGIARNGLEYNYTYNQASSVGYLGLLLGNGVAPGVIAEAETYMNAGGTRTAVADANARGSGNNAVNDTATSESSPAVVTTAGGNPFAGLPAGTYAMWARVRVTTSGDTLSVHAGILGPGSVFGSVATTTSTTWVWLYLGESIVTGTSTGVQVNLWRSAGAGATGVRIDALAVSRATARLPNSPNFDGGRDHYETMLFDARSEATLVER